VFRFQLQERERFIEPGTVIYWHIGGVYGVTDALQQT
jgi:hypothetical protein